MPREATSRARGLLAAHAANRAARCDGAATGRAVRQGGRLDARQANAAAARLEANGWRAEACQVAQGVALVEVRSLAVRGMPLVAVLRTPEDCARFSAEHPDRRAAAPAKTPVTPARPDRRRPPGRGDTLRLLTSPPCLARDAARSSSAGNANAPPERDVVDAFLADVAGDGVTATTAERYVRHLGRFAAWLEDTGQAGLLGAVPSDVREYLAQLATSQKPASVNAVLAALRRFYRWAHVAGRSRTDPTAKVKPAAQQPLSPKGFSTVERRRLVREAERSGPMAGAIVATLLHSGLRVDELVSLTWDAVTRSPRAGSARVVGKGRKLRTVPLNATVRDALAALRSSDQDAPTGPIFVGKRGRYSTRGIRDVLAVLGRRAGVADVHPHRFRHDCARRLVAAGVDLPTVAALLGHSRLDTVRLYSQPGEDELQRAAARLEEGSPAATGVLRGSR